MAGGAQHPELVGRAAELAVASQLLDDAAAGRARLLVLTGPAGVGKSTLVRALTTQASRTGARVMWGAGQEDLAIPYLPIAMAFEGLRDVRNPTPLRLDDDPTLAWARAGEQLLRATADDLVVLVIDDLQWTDPASQGIFLHLLVVLEQAALTRPVRCLTITTVRTPIEDERAIRTLSRIRRQPGVQVLDLPGLDRVEVADLMASLGPARPSALAVERVSEATAGNPLLVQSLVRRGISEGRLIEREGRLGLRDASDYLALDPSELDRGVIERLDALGDGVRRLLTVAAFLGDDQDVGELLAVAGLETSAADHLLGEAVDVGLLVEHGTRCGFAHPQVRHVLVQQPNRRGREALHLQIADALERRHGEAGALQVAHHLVRAASRAEPPRVAHWCRLAATQAKARGAWADASIAGQHALEALGDAAPWDDRADLHTLVTDMATYDFDLPTATRHGTAAIALAEAHDDAERWGRALLPLARALVTTSSDQIPTSDPSPLLQGFLRSNPGASAAVRARVLSLLSEISAAANRPDQALESATEAGELLGPSVDPGVAGLVLIAEGMARWARLDLREAADAYRKTIETVGTAPTERSGMYAAVRLNLVHHLAGDLDAAVRGGAAAMAMTEDAQVWGEHGLAAAGAASTALVLGQFDDVERFADLAERSVRRSSYLEPMTIAPPAAALGRALRGDGRGAYDAIDGAMGKSGSAARFRLAVDALLGDLDRVRAAVAERQWRDPARELTLRTLPAAVLHAEVGVAIGDLDMAAAACEPLRRAHERGVILSQGWAVLLSRLVGDCLAVSGAWEEAAAWLAVATQEAQARSIPLEAARIELSLARLLSFDNTSTPEECLAQASRAVLALDEVGALALVATARRLGRLDGDAEGPATRAILFTDLVGSTSINVRVGDQAFLDLVREHNDVVRSCLRRSSGVEFKHTGDGIAAWFTSPTDAVECAIAINLELERVSRFHAEHPFLVRCGLSSGEPLGNEGDLFGLSVVRAARLCAAAAPGEVLVGPEIVPVARAHGIIFQARGPMELKGFPEPVDVYVAVMTDASSTPR